MAFIAFDEVGGAGITAQPVRDLGCRTSEPISRGRLSALEWSVVAIAQKDRLSSLRRPGRLASALRVVFNQPNPQLGDERLEALRRMAVLTWFSGYSVPPAEVRRFLDAGFDTDQYETMADSIGAAKQAMVADRRLAA